MGFGQAASFVRSAPDCAAFAFYPEIQRGGITGGTLFMLHRAEFDDDGDWVIEAMTGQFNTVPCGSRMICPGDFLEQDMTALVGVDPRSLRYLTTTEETAINASWCGLHTALGILHGLEESVAERIEANNLASRTGEWGSWLVAHIPYST